MSESSSNNMYIKAVVDLVKDRAKPDFCMAEVGCWDGTTTLEYLPYLKAVGGKVYLVDHFKGCPTAVGTHAWNPDNADGVRNTLMKRVVEGGFEGNVEIIEGDSVEMAHKVPGNLDIVFLDASHIYEDVKKDIKAYLGKCKKGGLFVMHDVEDIALANTFSPDQLKQDFCRGVHCGVIQACYDYFGTNVKTILSPGVASIAVYEVKYKYFDELKRAMEWLGEKDDVRFVGQACEYPGTALYNTLKDIPQNKRLEFPVAENLQLGFTTALSLNGFVPVSIFPRWNFLLCATDQLVLHLDKLSLMSDYKPKVIIRTAVGSVSPLHPNVQHCGDEFPDAFRKMLKTVEIIELHKPEEIFPAYQYAYERTDGKSTIISEFADFYHEK